MKQTSSLTQGLADAQEKHAARTNAPAFNTTKTLYRLYTERTLLDLASYIGRYFAGATIFYGTGLDARTQDGSEESVTIEIVSSLPDSLQRVLDLAGDLRVAGRQISVLVTVQDIRTFEVTADVPTDTIGVGERS